MAVQSAAPDTSGLSALRVLLGQWGGSASVLRAVSGLESSAWLAHGRALRKGRQPPGGGQRHLAGPASWGRRLQSLFMLAVHAGGP